MAGTLVLAVAAGHVDRDVAPDGRLAPSAHHAGDDLLAFLGAVDGDAHASNLQN